MFQNTCYPYEGVAYRATDHVEGGWTSARCDRHSKAANENEGSLKHVVRGELVSDTLGR